jgi:hypothetical protein
VRRKTVNKIPCCLPFFVELQFLRLRRRNGRCRFLQRGYLPASSAFSPVCRVCRLCVWVGGLSPDPVRSCGECAARLPDACSKYAGALAVECGRTDWRSRIQYRTQSAVRSTAHQPTCLCACLIRECSSYSQPEIVTWNIFFRTH